MFVAAGHHSYAKRARLYVQIMKTYAKGSAEEIAIIISLKKNGNHVVRYSSNEWSSVWNDLTTEQTLMKNSKSEVVFRVVVFSIPNQYRGYGFRQ